VTSGAESAPIYTAAVPWRWARVWFAGEAFARPGRGPIPPCIPIWPIVRGEVLTHEPCRAAGMAIARTVLSLWMALDAGARALAQGQRQGAILDAPAVVPEQNPISGGARHDAASPKGTAPVDRCAPWEMRSWGFALRQGPAHAESLKWELMPMRGNSGPAASLYRVGPGPSKSVGPSAPRVTILDLVGNKTATSTRNPGE